MRVPVIFASGERGIVSSFDLDELLEENVLLAFYRPEGWVRVDCGEICDPSGTTGSSCEDRKTC